MKRTKKKVAASRTRRPKALVAIDYSGLVKAQHTAAEWRKLASSVAAGVRKAILGFAKPAATTAALVDETCWMVGSEVKPCDPENESGPLCIWQYWECSTGRKYTVKIQI